MAKKTKRNKEHYPFPQTQLHKIVYGWLKTFKKDGDLWAILTALRSCDIDGSESLKELTTARYRHILGLGKIGMLRDADIFFPNTNAFALDATDRQRRNKHMSFAPVHFREHHEAAVDVMREVIGYDLDTERKIG